MPIFVPAAAPRRYTDWKQLREPAVLVAFHGREVLLGPDGRLPAVADVLDAIDLPGEAIAVGQLNGICCFGVEAAGFADLPEGFSVVETRLALANLPAGSSGAICRARELAVWRRQHRFCGACGEALTESENDSALVCPRCRTRFYPQIAPAVIVAVLRENEILLAHNRNFLPGIYGLIAGFVEAGESVEQAIVREIREETGITVGNFRYLESQSWPFPNSLMLGFSADYLEGEARPDGMELETLGWFRADALPEIPPPGSIARRIIESFVERHRPFSR